MKKLFFALAASFGLMVHVGKAVKVSNQQIIDMLAQENSNSQNADLLNLFA
jgi:hypothetical protein